MKPEKEHIDSNMKTMEWATEHFTEWEIVCGLRNTTIQNTYHIMKMLKEAGLHQLSDMMASRYYQFLIDNHPGKSIV